MWSLSSSNGFLIGSDDVNVDEKGFNDNIFHKECITVSQICIQRRRKNYLERDT
jgi:hypothetical protein